MNLKQLFLIEITIIRKFWTLFTLLISFTASAGIEDFVLKEGNLAILAPPLINKNYYSIELGFVTEKKMISWNYSFNAYVTVTLFEDWLNLNQNLHAGGLGFKAGVILPTNPYIPLLFTSTLGYAKTALHENPIFGRDEQSVEKRNMILYEFGPMYRHENYFIRFAYQVSNVHYFHRHSLLMVGVNY